nr:hypothetical protein BaRGS_034280 [Batillaria attramentaria]
MTQQEAAWFVLSKYGYLRCQVRRRRREATRYGRGGRVSHLFQTASATGDGSNSFNPWDNNFELSEEGGAEVCDEAEVQKAIVEYQKTYNLPPTGQLDEETKLLMSTSRCGNKDNEEVAKTKENVTSEASTSAPASARTLPPTPPPASSDNVHIKQSVSRFHHRRRLHIVWE